MFLDLVEGERIRILLMFGASPVELAGVSLVETSRVAFDRARWVETLHGAS